MRMTIHIFGYHTLRNPAVRHRVLGRHVAAQQDHLDGFRRVPGVDGYQSVVPTDGYSVKGTAFKVTPDDLEKLDTNEDRYQRQRVTLRSGKNAWVYRLKQEET